MFLWRQAYRVTTSEGSKRLQVVLVEASTAVAAKAAAIETIQATHRDRSIELRGDVEHVPLPYHFAVGDLIG